MHLSFSLNQNAMFLNSYTHITKVLSAPNVVLTLCAQTLGAQGYMCVLSHIVVCLDVTGNSVNNFKIKIMQVNKEDGRRRLMGVDLGRKIEEIGGK